MYELILLDADDSIFDYKTAENLELMSTVERF